MGLAVWRDISLLWLIFLSLIAILPIGIVLFFAIKGMHRLRQLTVSFLSIAQEKASLVAGKTDEISRKVVTPFIDARAKAAQVNSICSAILTRRQEP